MSRTVCPACSNIMSNVSCPNDHEGYYISDRALEVFHNRAGSYEMEFDLIDWLIEKRYGVKEAHCCYECGHVWSDTIGKPDFKRYNTY